MIHTLFVLGYMLVQSPISGVSRPRPSWSGTGCWSGRTTHCALSNGHIGDIDCSRPHFLCMIAYRAITKGTMGEAGASTGRLSEYRA